MSRVLPHADSTAWRPHWVAEDAVRSEPVSNPNSLITGKLTGTFENFGPFPRFARPFNQQLQWLAAKFRKRGKSCGGQEVAQRCLTSVGKYGMSGWFGTLRRDP